MTSQNVKPMSWAKIIMIMFITAIVVGMILGFLGDVLGTTRYTTSSVGASVGVVGAILVMRRKALLSIDKQS